MGGSTWAQGFVQPMWSLIRFWARMADLTLVTSKIMKVDPPTLVVDSASAAGLHCRRLLMQDDPATLLLD